MLVPEPQGDERAVGPLLVFGPEGQTFANPVTVTIPAGVETGSDNRTGKFMT